MLPHIIGRVPVGEARPESLVHGVHSHQPFAATVLGEGPCCSQVVPEHLLDNDGRLGGIYRSKRFDEVAASGDHTGRGRGKFQKLAEEFRRHERQIDGKHEDVGNRGMKQCSENTRQWAGICHGVQKDRTSTGGVVGV